VDEINKRVSEELVLNKVHLRQRTLFSFTLEGTEYQMSPNIFVTARYANNVINREVEKSEVLLMKTLLALTRHRNI
jgi:hypothetical protein